MSYQTRYFCKVIISRIRLNETNEINESINWEDMVSLARDNNILPILVEGASKYASYTKRQEYMVELQETMAVVAAQVKRTESFLRIYGKLAKENIYPLVMKGLICRQLYGDLCDHRPSSDEDILIRPEQYWKAKEVLISNGYVPQLEVDTEERLEDLQEVSFFHPVEKLHIELHLNPIGKENATHIRMNEFFKNVFEHYREVEIQGVTVRTMGHYDHFLFLIIHAFKHFLGSGLGIRQLLDILLYQEQFGDEIDFTQLCETLKELNAIAFYSDMVHIGNKYFGFHLAAPLKPRCPEELLENMMESGTFGSRNEAEKIASNAMRQVSGVHSKGKSSKFIVVVWKSIFPGKEYMKFQAPYLEEKPWLLPIAWVKRWMNFIRKNKREDGNLAVEGMKTSRRRMKMLKKYDLM